jgi:hypothetical protein
MGGQMEQNKKAKALLLYTFLSIYIVSALGTLAMLFLGFGEVKEGERALLINAFLIETAIAIGALFYSVWEIKKKEDNTQKNSEGFIVNPLEDTFKDKVIPMDSLKLPTIQLHDNKHFKRCKFVGPSSMTIMGCTVNNVTFTGCGDIIPLPNGTLLAGILGFKNCTFDECEFIHITLMLDEAEAKNLHKTFPGAKVAGL